MNPSLQTFLQQVINGLSSGSIYALIAVGYTMVYGVLRLINFAHGDVYMIGAMAGVYAASSWFVAPMQPGTAPQFLLWIAIFAAAAGLLFGLTHLGRRRRWSAGATDAWHHLAKMAAVIGGALVVALLARLVLRIPARPSWWGLFVVCVAAMTICGLLGYVIEGLAYRPLRNKPRITALITAIGVSMFLEFGGQELFGATPRAFPDLVPGLEQSPELFHVGGLVVGRMDAIIFAVTIVLMLVLRHIVMKTRTGLALRAVSFRFDTAALMGIDVNKVVSVTFVLGSVLAAAAGVLVGLRSPKIEPLMGLLPGLKAFVAAVLGGIGNIPGALAGGLLLGLTEALVVGYFPNGSQYRDGVAFVILILVLLVKPSGLFGKNVIEKV